MAYYPPQQGYQPAPPYYPSQPQYQPYPPPAQSHHSSNVVVVASQPAAPQVVQTYVERDSPNHLLHCIITLFCPWWIFIWLCICCIYGC